VPAGSKREFHVWAVAPGGGYLGLRLSDAVVTGQ
jgi:hypothetical protein